MTEAASSANDIIIHSADGEGESVSMFGMKSGADGMLTMPGGSSAAYVLASLMGNLIRTRI